MKIYKSLGILIGISMLTAPIAVFADTVGVTLPSGKDIEITIPTPVPGETYSFEYEGQTYTVTLPGKTEAPPPETVKIPPETNTIIGSATTSYKDSTPERAHNVILGTKAVSGVLLAPGERFSVNEHIGETTPEKGYKEAGVYINNRLELGYGGGVCQISTTLYDAISNAGIIPTKRSNHSMPVSYVPLGLDATVAIPYLDLEFVNPFDYPIFIEGVNADNQLTFNIYSDAKATNGITYQLYSEIIETKQPKTNTIEDPNLPEGQTVQEVKPSPGYVVKVFRNTLDKDKKVINNEYMYTDTYVLVDEVLKVGTKKAQ